VVVLFVSQDLESLKDDIQFSLEVIIDIFGIFIAKKLYITFFF